MQPAFITHAYEMKAKQFISQYLTDHDGIISEYKRFINVPDKQ